jgi:hypothetical protein
LLWQRIVHKILQGHSESEPKDSVPSHMLQEDNFLWIAINHAQVDGCLRGAHHNACEARSAAYIENRGNTLENNLENGKRIREMKDAMSRGSVKRLNYTGTPFHQEFHMPHHLKTASSVHEFKKTATLPDDF